MRPIDERRSSHGYFDPDGAGRVYAGRGYVQLTGADNYARIEKLLREDLEHYPEKASEPELALQIATRGMTKGWFTGKKVSTYFTNQKSDWYGARVVNPCSPATHKPILVAYARKFTQCLTGEWPADQAAPKTPVKGCEKPRK